MKKIIVRGARVHNLKNIDVEIPRDKLVVITGISGSGKSSLAFDTIYAEGQRRYVESLSAYARQFLGLMDKPAVDAIEGLSPAISIDQRTVSVNPRSTVGTMTEIYDYLRLLFARVGRVHSPETGKLLHKQAPSEMVDQLLAIAKGRFTILGPMDIISQQDLERVLAKIRQAGFKQVRIDGKLIEAATVPPKTTEIAGLEIVVGKHTNGLQTKERDKEELARLVELALDFGNGRMVAMVEGGKEFRFSQHYFCPETGKEYPDPEPRNFSFNSPAGACSRCLGLGTTLEVDSELVIPNKKLTLAEGAVKPWARNFSNQNSYWKLLEVVGAANGFKMDVTVGELSPKGLAVLFSGTGATTYSVSGQQIPFPGILNILQEKHRDTTSDYLRKEIEQYMRVLTCPACLGKRLKPEALSITMGGKNIAEVTSQTIEESLDFFKGLLKEKSDAEALTTREHRIADFALKEVIKLVEYLNNVGLGYLTLNRPAMSLSGGESQRIRLATQLGLSLTGVLYILDEPSVGLHQRDNQKLIDTLLDLRDLGNTVIVVEHDQMMMEVADEIIDIGPGAGENGGRVIAQGSPAEISKNKNSLTGQYLSGALSIQPPAKLHKGNGKAIEIIGASEFNLRNVDVKIPLGKFIALTGVSGSGKSTLMLDILVKSLQQRFYRAKELPGKHKEIRGVEHIDKIIAIDQSPIGRTPRSNPATYTGVFTYIRDLFTQTKEAKVRGYSAGKFSFNSKVGQCDNCGGEGMIKIEMQFLPDIYVQCENCRGRRYKSEVLEVHYLAKNIADVLDMSVEEAMRFFRQLPNVYNKLKTLYDVGLGYVKLGQPATTLSGGEAQRVKLATELSRRSTGKTLYVLDEPTTGLHFEDIQRLLEVLTKLVDKGNTVLIIEHNLDVIKCADWVIDLGPEGGDKGGEIVAEGPPSEIIKVKRSYTGQYLKEALQKKAHKVG